MKKLLILAALGALFSGACRADGEAPNPAAVAGQVVTLPSALPSGFPANDTIRFTFYTPQTTPPVGGAPGLLLLHYLGVRNNREIESIGRDAARRGIAAAVMTLPYHLRRAVPGIAPANRFAASNVDDTVQAMQQSVSDVSTVSDWLARRPEVNPHKLGILGASLGAIIAHLAMGQDARLRAGVALIGGGDLPEIYRSSLFVKLLLRHHRTLTEDDKAKLGPVDPLTYAGENRPRHVLMVQAARDEGIPPRAAQELWQALGQPPIQWMDSGHFALHLGVSSVSRTALDYLEAVWNGDESAARQVPKVHVPTLKLGYITGLNSTLTTAVQWQALSLGRRRHMSLLSANLGLSGRGPFVGFAATASPFVDVGLGHRLFHGRGFTPYLSFHVVY